MAIVVHIMTTHKAERTGQSLGQGRTLQDPSDLLMTASPHPLKFPQPSKSCHKLGAKHLKYKPMRGIEDLTHNNAENLSTEILLVASDKNIIKLDERREGGDRYEFVQYWKYRLTKHQAQPCPGP